MNENPELQERLIKDRVICCISPPGNLSIVSNIGFGAATSDKIIITDSDTVFGEKCIKEMIKGLDSYDIVRAPLSFRRDDTFLSREIAEARDYVNSLPLIYTPGIGVTKKLPPLIKGFLFDDGIPFAVDANLDYRIKTEKLPALFLSDVWIEHSAENIRHDLHAARRIGAGCRQSTNSLHEIYPQESKKHIGKSLKGVKLKNYPDLLRKKGLRVLIYQTLWDFNYYYGYFGIKN